ncbi:hypothetical protein Fmac_025354 [Flemingia macrophylla]|uniref:Glycoside hydrolase family 13 N-terminal domain-containing protein n=1 Tax=Flemingia macrophylla TaxID=520843 RepID=A0ABD1LRZ2_9FABA
MERLRRFRSNRHRSKFAMVTAAVYCTHTAPDYSLPWQKQRQFTSTGRQDFESLDCSAALIGDFNNWNPNADVMAKTKFSHRVHFLFASVTRNKVDRRAISSVRREDEDSLTEKKKQIENTRTRARMIGKKFENLEPRLLEVGGRLSSSRSYGT